MNRVFNFSAGPAMLPTAVLEKAQAEILDWQGTGMSVMEMSHRGKEFMGIAEHAEATLREIIGPDATEEILAAAEELYPGFDKTFGEDSPRAGVDVAELESESVAVSMMEQSLEALKASGIDTEAVEELIAGFKLNQSSEGGDGTAEEQ